MNLLSPQGKDDGDQKRMLIAVVVCAGILLMWNTLFPQAPVQPKPGDGPASAASVGSASAGSTASKARTIGETPDAPALMKREALAQFELPGRHSVQVANDGQLFSWNLEEAQYRNDLEGGKTAPYPIMHDLVVAEAGKGLFIAPRLEVEFDGTTAQGTYTVVSKSATGATVAWTDPKTGVKLTRAYTLVEDDYTVDVTLTLENPGTSKVEYDLSALMAGAQNNDEAGGNMFSPPVYAFEGLCKRVDDFERMPVNALQSDLNDPDEKTAWFDGIAWAGVGNRYFMTGIVVPKGEAESCTLDLGAKAAGIDAASIPANFTVLTTRLGLKGGEITAGGSVTRSIRFYVGPKKLDRLRAQAIDMNDAIDFGWFTAICIPMLWLMQAFFGFVGNWGLAIILLTVFVKLITLPLTIKQYKSMAAMKKVQPKLKKIQEKYKDNKPKLQQEMMALYRAEKVNPMASCLPMLLMMPIYFSLYRTIYSAVELYRADFAFWISDLSEQDPFFILPVVLGVLFLLQTRLNPSMGDNPQQKLMMTIMPVMFTGMMLFLPSGLVLYILVNTGLGLVQQIFQYRKMAEDSSIPTPDKRTPKNRKRAK
ncbi:MAG: YidC/Oxa1 family membrane protein insertase [Bradymonadia bacterium]|jgi:YidC/Oxa1 family membrane protein insertase